MPPDLAWHGDRGRLAGLINHDKPDNEPDPASILCLRSITARRKAFSQIRAWPAPTASTIPDAMPLMYLSR
jgi:hypothetical protein